MIPIDTNLAAGLIALRILILFAIVYVLAVIVVFEFVRPGMRKPFLLSGLFAALGTAFILERFV